jgi:hypothetical protein
MEKECCSNCIYLKKEIELCYSGYEKEIFHCYLHNLHNGEVSHPNSQNCGNGFVSIKTKLREDKINQIFS